MLPGIGFRGASEPTMEKSTLRPVSAAFCSESTDARSIEVVCDLRACCRDRREIFQYTNEHAVGDSEIPFGRKLLGVVHEELVV